MRLLAAVNRAWTYLMGEPRLLTETEWLTSVNPVPMLEYLGRNASGRKLRLFACACCRRHWPAFDESARAAVEAAERQAEGSITVEQWQAACAEARRVLGTYFWSGDRFAIQHTALQTLDEDAWQAAFLTSAGFTVILDRATSDREDVAECASLRCLFGNPFHPVVCDPAWLSWHDGLVVSIARRIDHDRDFTDMPVLADALEEAGCTDAEILNHCCHPGEHVRGCWVVDLLLGKM
ncbi:MAG TPA: hypothetical protein VH643_32045 [Gemmataceae bacterium]|jgi:hypothetical protein